MHVFPEFSKLNLWMGAFLLGYNSFVPRGGIFYFIYYIFSFLFLGRSFFTVLSEYWGSSSQMRPGVVGNFAPHQSDTWKHAETLLVVGNDLLLISTAQQAGRLVNPLTRASESEVVQWCPTLCDPMDYSLPGSSNHGIFQARILEWVAMSFSRGSSWHRDQTRVSQIAGRCFTIWATREAH